jgi:hypothetical protein
MSAGRLLPTIALGLASQLVAIAIWYGLREYLDFDPMLFWFFFVLPVGAFCLGLLGSAGFFLAKKLNVPAGMPLAVTIVLTGLIAAGGMQYLAYATSSASDIMNFGDYLQFAHGDTTMSTDRGGGTIELGSFGYLMAAGASLAYALAGLVIYFQLRETAYCDDCGQYHEERSKDKLHFPTLDALHSFRAHLAPNPEERVRQLHAAQHEHATAIKGKGATTLIAKYSHCTSCGAEHLVETVAVNNGKGDVVQKPLRMQFDWNAMRGGAQASRRTL